MSNDASASEKLAAYHRMRPPQNCAEAVTAAELLGLGPDVVARLKRQYGQTNGGRESDEPVPIDTAALPRAVCALDAPPAEAVGWIVPGLIPAGEIGLIGSDGGAGKTTLALHIAGAIAGNYCVADHPRFQSSGGPVLIVSEEDPASVLLNRLEALAVGHRWDRDRVFTNTHLFALAGAKLTEVRWQRHLLAEVERIRPVGIILDPLFELTDGHEDSNTDQRPTVRFCRLLCQPSGAAVIILMHFGKAGEGKRKIDRLRGASAWYNAARFAYALEEQEGGVLVECLKMSRAVKPLPFVLEREVTADPANEGTWVSASLRHRSPHAVALDRAEQHVLEQLRDTRLNSTELKQSAHRTGISGADVSGAISRLEKAHRIDFEAGPKGSKLWGVVCLPSESGNQGKKWLPSLPDGCPASTDATAVGCPPLKGAGNLAGSGGPREPATTRRPWPPPSPRCGGELSQQEGGAWACPPCKGDGVDDPFREQAAAKAAARG